MSCCEPFNDFWTDVKYTTWCLMVLCGLNVAHIWMWKYCLFLSLSLKTLITTHKWFSSYWNVVEHTRKRIMSCNNRRSHVEVHLNSIKYSRVYVFVCMFLCVRYHLSLSSLNINFDVVGYYKMINQIYKWIFSKNKNTTSFCKIQNMLIW